jgi:methylmalonyl-CoA/ethylmalonyl-CoA epimerase
LEAAPLLAQTVDHIGIAVKDLATASRFYRDVLHAEVSEPMRMPDQGIAVVFIQMANIRVELIEAISPQSPIEHVLENHTINHYLDRHPDGGIHHVCYKVQDMAATRAELTARGYRVLGRGDCIVGASGKDILFLDPGLTSGTLIELKQA